VDRLFEALNPHRFSHTLSVALTSVRLAAKYHVNVRQAEEAGLLHDCAKCLPLSEMQRIARRHHLTEDPSILESASLLHSVAGAWVARSRYGMKDPEVLEAIAYHNTGHEGMSRLAMCVCLADSIEPTRASYPLLEQVRVLSELSLERALLMSLEGTAAYVRSRGKYLHPRTQETIAWLKTLPEARSGINQ
jgi:predicted HD superfamily hydrolase involved in NAD metabolism